MHRADAAEEAAAGAEKVLEAAAETADGIHSFNLWTDLWRAVAEAPWSGAERAVALRFDNPRATALVRLLGWPPPPYEFWVSKRPKHP